MDTGVFTGHQPMTDAWKTFRDFVERTEDLPIPMLVGGACHTPPGDEVSRLRRAVPGGRGEGRRQSLPVDAADEPPMHRVPRPASGRWRRWPPPTAPSLTLWAEHDPIIPPSTGTRLAERLGWPEPEIVEEASHFLQEDQGAALGERIAAWLVIRLSRTLPFLTA